MNIKWKAILSVMLILTVLSLTCLFIGVRYKKTEFNSLLTMEENNAKALINRIINTTTHHYASHLESFLYNNAPLLTAFKNHDKEKLYELSYPIYEILRKENPFFFIMHFSLPDSKSFLKVHNPGISGEDLSSIRPALREINKSQKPVRCLEVGRYGLFYRICYPVFYNNEYLGVLEYGLQIESVLDELKEHYLNDITYAVKKEVWKNADLADIKGKYINDFFVKQTSELFDAIPSDFLNQKNKTTYKYNNNTYCVLNDINLNDYKGNLIGKIIIARNMTNEENEFKQFVIYGSITTLIIILLIFLVLYFSFNSIFNKILELNLKLKAHGENLELIVKKRTSDLTEEIKRRKHAEKEIEQVFNTAGDPMRIIDKNFNMLKVNETFAKLSGLSISEIEGKKCYEILPGNNCNSPNCPVRAIVELKIPKLECDAIKQFMGLSESRNYIITAVPFYDTEQNVVGVVENFKDITERKKAEDAVKESEERLSIILNSVLTGIILVDFDTLEIIEANPLLIEKIGLPKESIIGAPYKKFFETTKVGESYFIGKNVLINQFEKRLINSTGVKSEMLSSLTTITLNDKKYLLESFIDITEIKNYMRKQAIDIKLSKNILNIVNLKYPCLSNISQNYSLFYNFINIPCYAEGGDHFLLRKIETKEGTKTLISLKDQSGHEVNCILRSIMTDLIHNSIISNNNDISLEDSITILNNTICKTNLFQEDDFVTAINLELNHNNLMLKYISAGHPNFFVIRNNDVLIFPKEDNIGANTPIGFMKIFKFKSSEFQLQEGDKIFLYTDGLTDIPLKYNEPPLMLDDLVKIIKESASKNNTINGIIKTTFKIILEKMNQPLSEIKYSFIDDVVILGLEIENNNFTNEVILKPNNIEHLSALIKDLYSKIKNQWQESFFESPDERLKISIEESILNAFKHGNNSTPLKPITVKWKTHNLLHICIKDDGNGFDPEKIEDPTLNDNIVKATGRGIYILKYYCDNVQWKQNGSEINLFFK